MANLDNEKELENFILNNAEEAGIYADKIYQQVPIAGYGVLDLLAISTEILDIGEKKSKLIIELTIIELKKGTIDYNALGQICRYKTALERIIKKMEIPNGIDITINGVLIGSHLLDDGDFVFVVNGMGDRESWLRFKTYELSLKDGLTIEDHVSNGFDTGFYRKSEDIKTLILSSKIFWDSFKSDKFKEIIKDYVVGRREMKAWEKERGLQ